MNIKLKFVGSKKELSRDHCVILVQGKYQKIRLNQTIEVPEEEGFRLRATGDFVLESEELAARRPNAVKAPPSDNRAILEKGE